MSAVDGLGRGCDGGGGVGEGEAGVCNDHYTLEERRGCVKEGKGRGRIVRRVKVRAVENLMMAATLSVGGGGGEGDADMEILIE